jgi:hypothetical protein
VGTREFPLRVQVRMYVSVNGRKPRIFLDPNVNLAAEPRTWGRPRWLLQIHDPLPPPGQDFSGEPFSAMPPEIDSPVTAKLDASVLSFSYRSLRQATRLSYNFGVASSARKAPYKRGLCLGIEPLLQPRRDGDE